MAIGLLFHVLSLFTLPYVIIFPHKFCSLNSLGSVFLIISIIQFKGIGIVRAFLKRENFVYTFGLVFGISLEIYFSMISKNYILVLIGFLIQFLSIVYLCMTIIPNGVKLLDGIILKTFGYLKTLFSSKTEEKEGFLPI